MPFFSVASRLPSSARFDIGGCTTWRQATAPVVLLHGYAFAYLVVKALRLLLKFLAGKRGSLLAVEPIIGVAAASKV